MAIWAFIDPKNFKETQKEKMEMTIQLIVTKIKAHVPLRVHNSIFYIKDSIIK